MRHLKSNKYSNVLSICSFFILTRILCFFVVFTKTKQPLFRLAADCYVSISRSKSRRILLLISILTNYMLFSCCQTKSLFVKNAFNNVSCISKMWTVSKLKLLITWLANTRLRRSISFAESGSLHSVTNS